MFYLKNLVKHFTKTQWLPLTLSDGDVFNMRSRRVQQGHQLQGDGGPFDKLTTLTKWTTTRLVCPILTGNKATTGVRPTSIINRQSQRGLTWSPRIFIHGNILHSTLNPNQGNPYKGRIMQNASINENLFYKEYLLRQEMKVSSILL